MGGQVSKSESSESFLDFFGVNKNFIHETSTGEKVLFSYTEEDVYKSYILVNAELLTKPKGSSEVTYRALKNCSCKSDLTKYEPSMTFKFYFGKEGFFDKKYTVKDSKFKRQIKELEDSFIF